MRQSSARPRQFLNRRGTEKTSGRSKLSVLVRRLYVMGERHPLFVAAVFCFFVGVGTACLHSHLSPLLPLFVICNIAYVCIYIYGKHRPGNKAMTLTAFSASLLVIAGTGLMVSGRMGFQAVRILIMFGLLAGLALLWKKRRLNSNILLSLILITGVALRVLCVLDFNIAEFQHDVCYFSDSADVVHQYHDGITIEMLNPGGGHAGYIEYLLHYGKLPDFDMRNVWSFYNPPFFHIISALWLRFAMLFMDYPSACESIQTISLFSSIAVLFLSYRLFRMLRLRKAALVVSTAIVAFSNALIQLAMNVNNDPLSAFLMLGAVLHTLRWYRSPGFRNIILTAVFLGLGMMTKLSVAVIAPAIAFVFLCVFISNIKSIRCAGKILAQFSVFLLICAPLGLFYQVRNLIRFGIPLTYLQTINDLFPEQYVGDVPMLQRLFGGWGLYLPWVHSKTGCSVRTNMTNEYNPFVSLVKTALFEEYRQNTDNNPVFDITGTLILIAAFVLVLVGIIKMFSLLKTARKGERVRLLFMLIAFVSMLISYYSFCFGHPYLCSQHIRYVPLTIVWMGFYSGRLVQDVRVPALSDYSVSGKISVGEKISGICAYVVYVLVVLIAAGSMMLF